MINENFVIIILTHGRPENVITYHTLKRLGYTGKILLLIDNEDKMADAYYKKYGDEVVMFDKKKEAETTDACDNFHKRNVVVYARNAAFRVAKEYGFRYFMQFDDDYRAFYYRMGKNYTWAEKPIKSIDAIFDSLLKYYIRSGIDALAIAQGGDFIGGGDNTWVRKFWRTKRKCMNSWICDVEKPLHFCGSLNEDCSQYTLNGRRGGVFLQIMMVSLNQEQTQAVAGGMTDIYKDSGTYRKTFYTILQAPSCTKIKMLGFVNPRIHHNILYEHCAAKIIREEYRKV